MGHSYVFLQGSRINIQLKNFQVMKKTTQNKSTEILAKANLTLNPTAAAAMQLLISFSLELVVDWIKLYSDRDIRSEFFVSLERVPQVLNNQGKKSLNIELQTIADVTGARPTVVYGLYKKFLLKDSVVLKAIFTEAISQFAGNIDSATIESGTLIVKLSRATAPKEELSVISDQPAAHDECETQADETQAEATISIGFPIREADPVGVPRIIEVVDVEIDSEAKATAS